MDRSPCVHAPFQNKCSTANWMMGNAPKGDRRSGIKITSKPTCESATSTSATGRKWLSTVICRVGWVMKAWYGMKRTFTVLQKRRGNNERELPQIPLPGHPPTNEPTATEPVDAGSASTATWRPTNDQTNQQRNKSYSMQVIVNDGDDVTSVFESGKTLMMWRLSAGGGEKEGGNPTQHWNMKTPSLTWEWQSLINCQIVKLFP